LYFQDRVENLALDEDTPELQSRVFERLRRFLPFSSNFCGESNTWRRRIRPEQRLFWRIVRRIGANPSLSGHSQLCVQYVTRYSYTRVYREFTRGFVNPTDIFSGYELSKCKSCQIHPRSVSGTYNRDQAGFGLHIRSSKAQIHFFGHIAFLAKILYRTYIHTSMTNFEEST